MKIHLKNTEAKKLLRNKKVIEEINRHKWLESEIAGYDIGFEAAAEDWLKRHAAVWIAYHANKKQGGRVPIKPISPEKKASCKVISHSLKNISEFPPSIQAIITDFANKFLEKFDDNTHSVLVYGSAAGVNFIPGVSNINIAVIVKTLDFAVLNQSLDLVKWCRKHKMATPLLLTKEYILNSLDVFPVEFSEIKEQHKVIFGEDIFKDLDIPRKDVRLLCEQQVKGKLLHLRQAYLDIGPNPPVLKNLLLSALNDLTPIFRQLIILKGQKPVENKEEMLDQLAKIFSLDLQPFIAVYHDKAKKILISSHQIEAHLQNFLNQLENLSRHMDSL